MFILFYILGAAVRVETSIYVYSMTSIDDLKTVSFLNYIFSGMRKKINKQFTDVQVITFNRSSSFSSFQFKIRPFILLENFSFTFFKKYFYFYFCYFFTQFNSLFLTFSHGYNRTLISFIGIILSFSRNFPHL